MEKIVRDVLEGRSGAARRFYEMYATFLRGYLRGRLPSADDAEEVLQDVFLSAFDSLPLFRGKSSVKTWLFSIARHEVADYYRKRYVRKVVEQTGRLFEGLGVEVGSPEFEWEKIRIRERFEGAMQSVSGKYRRVLFLRYEMGMSVKEVAEQMKMSFKATESVLYRARMAFVGAYEKAGA